MATVVNTRDVLLLAASPRLLWTGVQGISVVADTNTFKVTSAGVPTPSTINLTANLNGVSGTVTWSTSFGSATVVGVGASVTLPYANLVSNVATITASVSYGGTTYSGSVTISKVADGAQGITGATGDSGDNARIAYTLVDGSSLASSPASSVVSGDSKPATGTWGETRAWTNSPSIAGVGQAVFQSTGTYSPTANQTVWTTPYLSNLKVGALSAITTETGTLTVGTTGNIKGGQSNYDTGNGFWLGYTSGVYRFSIGNANNKLTYDGSVLEVRANTGRLYFGSSTSDATMSLNRFSGAYSSNALVIGDDSTGTGSALYVYNGGFFAGQSMAVYQASMGESIRAITLDTSRYATVHQNLGATTAIALAGTTYSGFAGSGDGIMNIADGYLPFTGCHVALIESNILPEIGDIVCDKKVVFKIDVSNTVTEVVTSYKVNDKSAIGVYCSQGSNETILDISKKTWYNLTQKFDIIHINSVGEGMINVCGQNGDLEIGDLITTSHILGKGMKQSDDIIRNYTVAKVRENVKFDCPDQVKMVACIYLCG